MDMVVDLMILCPKSYAWGTLINPDSKGRQQYKCPKKEKKYLEVS